MSRRIAGARDRSDAHRFADRRQAGAELARVVLAQRLPDRPLVLGLPRGGVPVAFEVARALRAPLDVLAVRKLGAPGQPELAVGAIAAGGILVREPGTSGVLAISYAMLAQLGDAERIELARREQLYRAGKPPLALRGRTVVLVDDGLATGATMLAAVRSARAAGAGLIVVAVPVASPEAVGRLRAEADRVIALQVPAAFAAVGEWYEQFDQTPDEEVIALLGRVEVGPEPQGAEGEPRNW